MPEVKIDPYIRELLYAYDCVILPGFGGLVAQAQPASINPISRQIFPPSKKVAFNQNLVHNDGLLTSHISRLHGCTYAEALLQVHRYVDEARKQLQQSSPFSIAGVGTFRMNGEENVQFSPEKTDNFLYDSFGLKPVSAIPVTTQVQESKPRILERTPEPVTPKIAEPMVENEPVSQTSQPDPAPAPKARRRKRISIPLVAASTFVVAFALLTVYMASNNISVPFLYDSQKQTSSFANTTYVEPKAVPEAATTATPETETVSPAASAEVAAAPEKTGKATNVSAEPIPAPENSELPDGYYVIAGAFMNDENATRLVSQLRETGFADAGYAGRTESSHLLRVAYMHSSNRMEAERELNRIRSTNGDAWILKLNNGN